jgi:YtcA family
MKGLEWILAFLPDPIAAIGSSIDGPTRVKGKLLDRIAAAAVSMLLDGCSSAPSRNILGSYFPSWMICALIGMGATVAVRVLLAKTGIDAVLPMPIVVYLAFATAFSLAVWLLWLA